MTNEQWEVVSTAQVEIQQLASLLRLAGHGADDGHMTDALYACATMADDIARRIYGCPGYDEALRRGQV